MNDPSSRYLNRELSEFSFHERVLALAARDDLPLLERTKFLAIFTTNLDEFFQVRVGRLKRKVAAGITEPTKDGMTPRAQLDEVRQRFASATSRQDRLLLEEIGPLLEKEGVFFRDWSDLGATERQALEVQFHDRMLPVLTPLAVDEVHPFPFISNLSLNLWVTLRDPDRQRIQLGRVKAPSLLERFVRVPGRTEFIPIEQVIAAHLDQLFPGLEVMHHGTFRVTRDTDYTVDSEETDDLRRAMEEELTEREFGRAVRLEVGPGLRAETRELLQDELGLEDDDVYPVGAPLDLGGLWALQGLDLPALKRPPWNGVTPPPLDRVQRGEVDIFEVLREQDVLVQHPYDDFATTTEAFIESAARDPQVLALKQTLYRTSGGESPVVAALIEAARRGKQVMALVELQARFDEERNIERTRALEEYGIHVAYGVTGLKTHTKTALVVRQEGDEIRRYAHIGTGNYNDETAGIYEDLGLLTADPEIAADLTDLFNYLSGHGKQRAYRKLLAAPTTLRPRILELIERERRAGVAGRIVLKTNHLVDAEIIDALYRASSAGCRIDLLVRTTCCLRPEDPELSQRIRVRSIVGRYLEHSRIYRFGHTEGDPRRPAIYLVGSADLMPRNLDRRVEAVVPVETPALQRRLDEILAVALRDDELAWRLDAEGGWHRVEREHGIDSHAELQRHALERAGLPARQDAYTSTAAALRTNPGSNS